MWNTRLTKLQLLALHIAYKMTRPKLRIELEQSDLFVEVLGRMGVILLLAIPLFYYGDLPDTIPTHFNAAGEPDQYGRKAVVWLLPLIGLVTYLGLLWLNKYPHIFNYMREITEENAYQQYQIATRMVRAMNVIIMWAFAYLTYAMIQISLGYMSGLGDYFIPIFLLVLFGTIGYYLFQSLKK